MFYSTLKMNILNRGISVLKKERKEKRNKLN